MIQLENEKIKWHVQWRSSYVMFKNVPLLLFALLFIWAFYVLLAFSWIANHVVSHSKWCFNRCSCYFMLHCFKWIALDVSNSMLPLYTRGFLLFFSSADVRQHLPKPQKRYGNTSLLQPDDWLICTSHESIAIFQEFLDKSFKCHLWCNDGMCIN